MVHIKSQRELAKMRRAGEVVGEILSSLAKEVRAGVTLVELDEIAAQLAQERNVICAFKGYLGFPKSLCTSVNEQIVHGIPNTRALQKGDIVGLDFGVIHEGYYGDSAVTVPVGKISPKTRKLLQVTQDALYAGIETCRPGNTLKDLAAAIENVIKPHGYGIVREFVGHGIGQKLHEDPQVPNYTAGASNMKLQPGMTIAIEPMVNEGTHQVKVLADRWTAVTADGSLSAHYEHTIAITENGPEILTEWDGKSRFGGLLEQLEGGG